MPITLPSDYELELIVRSLPAAPRILAELAPRLQALDTDVPEITPILRRDSGLSARLIDMANSAAFHGFEPATSIEDAVTRVGFQETYRIVGAVASTQLAYPPLRYYAMQPQRLHENSLFCALVMEELSDAAQLASSTAYTVGLLRSVGKIVLDRIGREGRPPTPFDARVGRLTDWEQAIWGCTNADVAARVLEIWGFPSIAVETVRSHYAPGPKSPRDALLLNLTAGAAEAFGVGLPGEQSYWHTSAESCEEAGIDESRLTLAAERARVALTGVYSNTRTPWGERLKRTVV
jgi:HD-like signal output (HDOD) protein